MSRLKTATSRCSNVSFSCAKRKTAHSLRWKINEHTLFTSSSSQIAIGNVYNQSITISNRFTRIRKVIHHFPNFGRKNVFALTLHSVFLNVLKSYISSTFTSNLLSANSRASFRSNVIHSPISVVNI